MKKKKVLLIEIELLQDAIKHYSIYLKSDSNGTTSDTKNAIVNSLNKLLKQAEESRKKYHEFEKQIEKYKIIIPRASNVRPLLLEYKQAEKDLEEIGSKIEKIKKSISDNQHVKIYLQAMNMVKALEKNNGYIRIINLTAFTFKMVTSLAYLTTSLYKNNDPLISTLELAASSVGLIGMLFLILQTNSPLNKVTNAVAPLATASIVFSPCLINAFINIPWDKLEPMLDLLATTTELGQAVKYLKI